MSGARTVIIGAGHAGVAAASKLRELSTDMEITLVSADMELPYQRPPLSKAFLSGKTQFDQILLKPESWYSQQGITLLRGRTALSIDRRAQSVLMSVGEPLAYDHLVLCLGAAARRLPAEMGGHLPNVFTMRDLSDARQLKSELREGRKLVVIGGGYIGLEAASEARKLGVEVTVLESADRILQRVAAAETSDYVRALHLRHGVDIREKCGLEKIVEHGGRAAGVELANGGFLAADFVVTGIGVVPNTSLAEAAGLETDNGILADAFLRTSDPLIYAVGDCASFPFGERKVRLESVQNASEQGSCAAAGILGQSSPYHSTPWFWSDQFELKLQIAGLNLGHDAVVTRQGSNPSCRAHFYFKEGQFIAVDCLNDPLNYAFSRRILDRGRSLSPAQAADPAFNLKELATGL